ncbi:MAG: DUF1294 domain-containing protein [Clostridia bacterium]
MGTISKQLVICWILISLVGIAITVFDKLSAKRSGQRIPEFTLLLIAFLGAALPMYITMRLIHHKTRHKKFMIGLPIIFVLQIIMLVISLSKIIFI